ncbi:MAG: DUF4386 domain-containing protein [Ornithinimicrobium sp.]
MSAPTAPAAATARAATEVAPRVTSRRAAARIAGVSYVLMFALAIFANFTVLEGLVIDGDATRTVANLTGSLGMFRLGVVAFLLIALLDLVIAWALFVVLRDVHHDLALLAAWSRLVYTVLLGVALVYFFQVIALLTAPGTAAIGPEVTGAQVMLALGSFDAAWLIGLAVFGVHLILLGALLIRSQLVPRVPGVLLVVAGSAYLADTLAHALLPNYSAVADIFLVAVALPSMIGEGWLGLWLLFTRRLPTTHVTTGA